MISRLLELDEKNQLEKKKDSGRRDSSRLKIDKKKKK